MFKAITLSILALSLIAPAAKATDVEAAAKLEAAKALFAQRDDLAKNDEAITTLDAGFAVADSAELKYRILVLKSRAQFWKGWKSTVGLDKKQADETAMPVYDAGKKTATAAVALLPDLADGQYYLALNLVRWAKHANLSLPAKLKMKIQLDATLNKVIALKSLDGKPGKDFDGYGADRINGAVYTNLEKFDKAESYLQIASEKAPDFAANGRYLGEMFILKGIKEKDADTKSSGCDILSSLLETKLDKFNPDRVPETKLELDEATKIKQDNCN